MLATSGTKIVALKKGRQAGSCAHGAEGYSSL